jgi:hypothetical protein
MKWDTKHHTISSFNGSLTGGYASFSMTKEYNPKGYLDVYYLISPSGKVVFEEQDLSSNFASLMSFIQSSVKADPKVGGVQCC